MAFSQVTPVIGQQQQGFLNVIDVVQKEQLGTVISCVDNYWGAGEFMYVSFPAGAAVTQGQVMVMLGYGSTSAQLLSASVAPITANTGRGIGIAINPVANLAVAQFGWVQISGAAVVKAVASVAAGVSFGIDTAVAGSVNAVSAGRQVLNAVSVAPATTTVVKSAVTISGSTKVVAQNVDGWVPGMLITGTGITGGTTIVSIDPDNRTIVLSAVATAGGTTTLTVTYTGFIVAMLQRAFIQGQIV